MLAGMRWGTTLAARRQGHDPQAAIARPKATGETVDYATEGDVNGASIWARYDGVPRSLNRSNHAWRPPLFHPEVASPKTVG